MIALYEKTETNFTHNGLGILDNHIIAPVVAEELNGLFLLEFDYPARAPHAQDILPERIVKCPVPDMPDQLFRIAFVKKGLSGISHFTAYHVFYDLMEKCFSAGKEIKGALHIAKKLPVRLRPLPSLVAGVMRLIQIRKLVYPVSSVKCRNAIS